MFTWLFFAAVAFALLDWFAAWKENQRLLWAAKPLTIVFMMLWSLQVSGWQGGVIWFALGLIFSLVGDVVLLFSARFFMLGLASFLVAHIMFIIGFSQQLAPFSLVSIFLALVVGWMGSQILRRVRQGIATKPGAKKMLTASLIYGMVLSLMLLSALLTLLNPAWGENAAICASCGAGFFFVSDSALAYDRFVRKISHGRFFVHLTYHVGLFGIVFAALLHFAG